MQICVLKTVPVPGISYVWRSILKGINLLKEGLIWTVGDGTNVDIWAYGMTLWILLGVTWLLASRQGKGVLRAISSRARKYAN
jgi:hypothetical protein